MLGRSGPRVAELCSGVGAFGEDRGRGAPRDGSCRVFDAFVEASRNLIETGNHQTSGASGECVGAFIASEQERFVLATKCMHSMGRGELNARGNDHNNLAQTLEVSLRRLDTGYIDLCCMCAWDFMTPVEEVVRAQDDVVRAAGLSVGAYRTHLPAWSHSDDLAAHIPKDVLNGGSSPRIGGGTVHYRHRGDE